MRSILVQGELSNDQLASTFQGVVGEVQTVITYAFGSVRVVLLVGRKFFFRSNDYLGLALLATTDGTTQRIDMSIAGGGSGVFGVQWGAGASFEEELYQAISSALAQSSLNAQEVTAS